jgi:hypothetical protein
MDAAKAFRAALICATEMVSAGKARLRNALSAALDGPSSAIP